MLQYVSSEEKGEQTKYISEWFQENVCKTINFIGENCHVHKNLEVGAER